MVKAKLEVETLKTTVKPGSPEMEAVLSAGYPDIISRENAEYLIKTRKENPALVPYEVMLRAKAFLEALDAKPGDVPIYHPSDEEQEKPTKTRK
jgi:hypothetical protein